MKKQILNMKKFGAKIQEYKDKEQSDIESSELVKSELEQANTILGKTDVQGEGIVVTLREKNIEETGIINANDYSLISLIRTTSKSFISTLVFSLDSKYLYCGCKNG